MAPPPAPARLGRTATLLADGKVLLAGGCQAAATPTACGPLTAAAQLYDPDRNQWSATADMTVARVGHSATLLPNGKVLVAGGCAAPPAGSPGCFPATEQRSAELYDPSSGKWSPTGEMAVGHHRHSATLLPSTLTATCGAVLAVGSSIDPSNNAAGEADAEVYDAASGTWSPTAPSQLGRAKHTATLLQNGKVLVVGGVLALTNTPTGRSELYDPAKAAWSPTGTDDAAPRFFGHSATLLPGGEVLVAGGTGIAEGARKQAQLYDSRAAPDPANPQVGGGAWRTTGSLAVERSYHTATLLADGSVLVAGGADDASTELYDPIAGEWKPAGTMPSAAAGSAVKSASSPSGLPTSAATLLSDGSVLVIGPGFADRYDHGAVGATSQPGRPQSAPSTCGGKTGRPIWLIAVVAGAVLGGAALLVVLVRRKRASGRAAEAPAS